MIRNVKEPLRWYAYRIFHNKIKLLKEQLAEDHVEYFVPSRLIQKKQDDKIIYIEEPIIPSLLFIRSTEDYLRKLKERHPSHLGAYTLPGTRHLATIPDHEMEVFMYVLSKGCQQLETIDEKLVQGKDRKSVV